MSVDFIALCVLGWATFSVIMVFSTAEENLENRTYVMMTFWPVTLPILALFGFFYAIWSATRVGIRMFRE